MKHLKFGILSLVLGFLMGGSLSEVTAQVGSRFILYADTNSVLFHGSPNAVHTGPANKVYVATAGGCSIFDGTNWDKHHLQLSMGWYGVDITIGTNGYVWYGTSYNRAIGRYDHNSWFIFDHDTVPHLNYFWRITAMTYDDYADAVWFSLEGDSYGKIAGVGKVDASGMQLWRGSDMQISNSPGFRDALSITADDTGTAVGSTGITITRLFQLVI